MAAITTGKNTSYAYLFSFRKGKYTSESKIVNEFPICFIPEAAHGMMIENPDAFYQAVIDFLLQF